MIRTILFLLVLTAANTVQVITGFAGNLLAMPPALLLTGYETAAAVLNLFTLAACLLIAVPQHRFIDWRELAQMLLFLLAGIGVSFLLLRHVNKVILKYAYGIIIIAVALQRLTGRPHFARHRAVDFAVLLGAGIMHGLFVSGGALLVVYAAGRLRTKETFRATIASVWVILDTVLIFSHLHAGYYTGSTIRLSLLSLIPLALSLRLGMRLYHRLSPDHFAVLVSVLLLISGTIMIAGQLFS